MFHLLFLIKKLDLTLSFQRISTDRQYSKFKIKSIFRSSDFFCRLDPIYNFRIRRNNKMRIQLIMNTTQLIKEEMKRFKMNEICVASTCSSAYRCLSELLWMPCPVINRIRREEGFSIKGTINIISSDPPCKDANARLTRRVI